MKGSFASVSSQRILKMARHQNLHRLCRPIQRCFLTPRTFQGRIPEDFCICDNIPQIKQKRKRIPEDGQCSFKCFSSTDVLVTAALRQSQFKPGKDFASFLFLFSVEYLGWSEISDCSEECLCKYFRPVSSCLDRLLAGTG